MTYPNRDGWVNWPLSDLPPNGPFPEFTKFEANALAHIATQYGEAALRFREHIAAAKVIDRIHTGVGFYTRIIVDHDVCRPIEMVHEGSLMIRGGGTFEVPGIPYGVCVVLWGKNGYLDQIEGVTCGDDSLDGFALDALICGKFLG